MFQTIINFLNSFDLAFWGQLAESILKIGALLTFLWGVVVGVSRFIYKPIKNKIYLPIKEFWYKVLIEDRQKLDFLVAELKPNHGGSIKDHINLIRDSVLRTEMWQKTRLSHENLPYFDTDPEGRITWVNKSFLKMFAASEMDVLGVGIRNFIDQKDKERAIKDWEAATSHSIDVITSFKIKDNYGHHKCVECRAYAVRGSKNNEIIGYSGSLTEKDMAYCNN